MAGGKRRNNRNGNTADTTLEEDYLETSSQESIDSSTSSASNKRGRKHDDESENPINLEDKLSAAVDALSEKRATTREGALHTICTILTLKYIPDLLSTQIETLMQGAKTSISKPANEGELAAKVLALASLTLGQDANLSSMLPIMRELARDPSFRIPNKTAIIDALSAMLLVEDQNPNSLLDWLSFAESIFSDQTADTSIIKASLDFWGVVATQIDSRYMAETINSHIAAHEKLLDHVSTDVRISIGENIGILFEMMDDQEYDNKAELIEKLGDLAVDASRHKGKKENRSQRTAFKEVLATVVNADKPTQHLTIRKMDYSLTSWASLKRLNLIKYYLNEGLSVHLEGNEVVQAYLSLEVAPEAPERPTGQAKRVQQLIKQKVDKARTKNLSIERERRNSSRHSMYDYE